MTDSFRVAFAVGLAIALGTSGCGDDDQDMTPSDDAGIEADGSVLDAESSTDAGAASDAGDIVTITSCDGLTPIATVHTSSAGGFSPANIAVSVGDIVKWANDDNFDHTVTTSTFSAELEGRGTTCVLFSAPASHDYHCAIHPEMTGSVEVTAP